MANEKMLNTRIQHKIDTAAHWELATNFSPLEGEIIVYSDLNKIKIGDGKTNVNDLEFIQAETTSGSGQGSTTIGSGTASGENSTVIGTGTASGVGATVIGSGEATGTGATAIGGGTATGDYSVAEGSDTLAGCKGFYIAAIDPVNNQIYLHTGEDSIIPTWNNPSSYYDPTFESGYRVYLGDVNDDGLLTEEDADLIMQHAADGILSELQQKVADVDKGGDINTYDGALIMQYLAGWDVGLDFIPYCNEFSISSDGYYHWVFAGNIVEVSGNRITYGENNSLNDTEKWLSNVNDGATPMTFFIPSQPDYGTTNVGWGSHAEGYETHAAAQHSHAEGYASITAGRYGHAEGFSTRAGYAAHAEGKNTFAFGLDAHAEGSGTKAIGNDSHTEGIDTEAIGKRAHAEGQLTHAIGENSHAEGQETYSEGDRTHAEGYQTRAIGVYSHSEGGNTISYDKAGHAEGLRAISLGLASHAEGYSTNKASDKVANLSASTKLNTIKSVWDGNKFSAAVGDGSHVEGKDNLAGVYAHAEGLETVAKGEASHTEGKGTIATEPYQHVQGKYNHLDNSGSAGNYAHIVGNGTSTQPSNAYTLDWDGNAWFAGKILAKDAQFTNVKVNSISSDADCEFLQDVEVNGKLTAKDITVQNTLEVGATVRTSELYTDNIILNSGFNVITTETAVGNRTKGYGEIFNDYGNNQATGKYSHAEGRKTTAVNEGAHIEGTSGIKSPYSALDDANKNEVLTDWSSRAESIAERYSQALGVASHVEGTNCLALGSRAHAEGQMTVAYGSDSHAEGKCTKAEGNFAHAEGLRTTASGAQSHTEGSSTIASGENAHAEGTVTKALLVSSETSYR